MKTCDGMSGKGQGGVEVRVKFALPLDTERVAQQAAKCKCGVQGRVQAGDRNWDVDIFHITEIGKCPKLTVGQVKLVCARLRCARASNVHSRCQRLNPSTQRPLTILHGPEGT